MDAQIIHMESKEYVKAFLQALNSLYGTPIVVVRDRSKLIREAVTEVFPEAQQQICHYHFVNNLGKLIFKEKYAAFRKSIVKMQTLSQLKRMKEDMKATLADIDKEGEACGGELLRAARQITKIRRQHTNELFVDVKDSFGNVVEIMRDRNIEERSHRWSRKVARRNITAVAGSDAHSVECVGLASVEVEVKQKPEQEAILKRIKEGKERIKSCKRMPFGVYFRQFFL
jgi:AAA+ ATPase superfamily predicted ATPase